MRNKAVKLLEDVKANILAHLPYLPMQPLKGCREKNGYIDSLYKFIRQDATQTIWISTATNSAAYNHYRHQKAFIYALKYRLSRLTQAAQMQFPSYFQPRALLKYDIRSTSDPY